MSASQERAIRSVCVAGAGLVGLSAAIAFARALPAVRVTVLELPEDPAALADRLPGTLPNIHRFHAAIGLEEAELVRDGAALHRIGTGFENWPPNGGRWFQIFGSYGASGGAAAFHQLWARARRSGTAAPFHSYAPAAALAAAEKFVHPSDDPASPLSTYSYAMRLDPQRYRERLLRAAERLATVRRAAEIAAVQRRPDGGVAALRLTDGSVVEADLFLDCAGPSRAVHSAVSQEVESWAEWMPFDRLTIEAAPPPAAPTPCDSVVASTGGWTWSAPLADRTVKIGLSAGGAGAALKPGWRPDAWARNVLALGDAAIALDPLHGTNLVVAQSAILRALELLPGRDCHPLELREYNRRWRQEATRVRDFVALHYLRSGRSDGERWRAAAAAAPPDTLAHTLEQFEARGRLPFFEEETFDNDAWLGALLGLGVVPRAINPAAASVDPRIAEAGMARLAVQTAALPRQLPTYAAYLPRMR